VFTGQTTTRGLNRIWMFRAGMRVSNAVRELLYIKVKILWDTMLYRVAIIIIIIIIIITRRETKKTTILALVK